MALSSSPEPGPGPDQPFQVSFTVENVGKNIEASKKRVTWVFGQGSHEYTVTLQWSKRSGKRFVYMANEEVFFEEKKSVTFFHRWTTQDKKTKLHILATAATPSKKAVNPNFIKFELIINGQRFVKLSKKDGSPADPEEPHSGPGSIFDILYPQGYHEKTGKCEGAFNTKSAMTKEVNRRIMKQANCSSHSNQQ